jgi:large subunit ribosomal protein L4
MANEEKKPAPVNVKVRNKTGADAGQISLDEAKLGGMVKNRLMHSAVVIYLANRRSGTHCTKTRAEISGSTKKLYRQKGTGRARAGSKKAVQRKHGGIAHGPKPRKYGFDMPKKQRRAALNSAVLGKAKDNELQVIAEFGLADVKTKALNELLKTLGLVVKGKTPSVLLVTNGVDRNVHLSARNLPGVDVLPVADINAHAIIAHKNVVFAKAAWEAFEKTATRTYEKKTRKPSGSRKAKNAPATAAAKG